VTLVLGEDTALVIDTLSTTAQAQHLLAAVRSITSAPLLVINTHHHFDHCFGNTVLGAPAFAHPATIALLRDHGDRLRRQWHSEWLAIDPQLAAGLLAVTIRPPEHPVATMRRLDLGGREVTMRHLGLGHTTGDLVIEIPDARVIVAGDLVESSGPPQFEDAYPARWPETLTALLERAPSGILVIPGHGEPIGRDFVAAQRDDLSALARLIEAGQAAGISVAALVAQATARKPLAGPVTALDPATAKVAVRRGLEELRAGAERG
jgi:glyoxylase-like metal-dependent hydrolase (beta-lactamase superfamily II)